MKRIILLITFGIISNCVFADGLNANAKLIKTSFPVEYEQTLKKHALIKWDDDYRMVVYEINNQADALIDLIDDSSLVVMLAHRT